MRDRNFPNPNLLYHSDPESTGQIRTLLSLNLKHKMIQQSTFIEYWCDTIFGNLYTMKQFYAQNYEIILHKKYHQSMFGSTNYYVIPILKCILSKIFEVQNVQPVSEVKKHHWIRTWNSKIVSHRYEKNLLLKKKKSITEAKCSFFNKKNTRKFGHHDILSNSTHCSFTFKTHQLKNVHNYKC